AREHGRDRQQEGQPGAHDGVRRRRAVAVGTVLMRRATAMTVLVPAAGAAGCDWREFDDLKKKTPVVSIDAPSDYPTKEEFGAILLAVPPPKDHTSAARFVATATHTSPAAIVWFNSPGAPNSAC